MPPTPAPDPSAAITPSGPTASPPRVILVVDDALDSLRMLCDALADAGYTVLVARDALEALERIELATPDAILLDAIMPGEDGYSMCRRLKATPAWAHVPVIFIDRREISYNSAVPNLYLFSYPLAEKNKTRVPPSERW